MGIYVKTEEGLFPAATVLGPEGPEGPVGPPGSVDTVNGKPGPVVVLDSTDVGAAPTVHDHTSLQVTDFTEAVQDAVAALLTSGTQVQLTYDDTANTLQITATGADAETMRDTVGAALVGTGNVSVVVNDAADTITFSITGVLPDGNLPSRLTQANLDSTYKNVGELVADGELPNRLKAAAVAVTDWNNATESGWYESAPTALNVPPVSVQWVGEVIRHSTGAIIQTLRARHPAAGATNTWQRFYSADLSAWQPWVRHYTSELDLDGRYVNVAEGIVDAALPGRLRQAALEVVDWNGAVENGWYKGQNAANGPDADSGSWWFAHVVAHGTGDLLQTAYKYVGTGSGPTSMVAFSRWKLGGTWGSWLRLRRSEAELDARYMNEGAVITDAQLPIQLRGEYVSDANDATEIGTYLLANGAQSVNEPPGTDAYAYLQVQATSSGSFIYQEWTPWLADQEFLFGRWWRVKQDTGGWSAWYPLLPKRLEPAATSVGNYATSYWTKVATFTITGIYSDLFVRLGITSQAVIGPYAAELTVSLRNNDTLAGATFSFLHVQSKIGMTNDNIRLVKSQTSNGTTPNIWELWIQAPNYATIKTFELSRNFAGSASVAYHKDSGWQASAGSGTVIPDSVDSGWIGPSLQAGWVNFGGGYAEAKYRKIGNKVSLKGFIKSGTVAAGTVLFTLPVGYRPIEYIKFPATTYNVQCNLRVGPDGTVAIDSTANADSLSLNSISFLVD